MILGLIAGSRFSYDTGTSGTVTVPANRQITGVSCHVANGGAAGSLTVTPKGANQTGVAGGAIPLPAGVSLDTGWLSGLTQLGPGTILVFAGTDAYLVTYASHVTGG